MVSKKLERFNLIREKIICKLSYSDIMFLRDFCKKHWYFALYDLLDFDRLSLTKKQK